MATFSRQFWELPEVFILGIKIKIHSALLEDPTLIPRTRNRRLATAYKLRFRDSNSLFWYLPLPVLRPNPTQSFYIKTELP